jgi:apolipoprotein N-acyltransferase
MTSADSGSPDALGRWQTLGLAGLTFVLSLPLFAPWSWWPLGFVVFVPWLVGLARSRQTRWVYVVSYLLGAAFILFHFRWLYDTTPEGYVAASLLYLAPFFPLAAWPIRHLHLNRRIPLAIVFPVVWTAADTLRAHNPLGFPWFYLGHSQIQLLPMIQIADLTGVYGITFVLAAVNGCLADLLLARRLDVAVRAAALRRVVRFEIPLVLALVAGTIGYGEYRLRTSQFSDGPKTAVLQGDFLLRAVANDPEGATEAEKERGYYELIGRAVTQSPDVELIVLPETPWAMYLNREMRKYAYPLRAHERWVSLTTRMGKSVVVGAMSEEPQPEGTYPSEYRYNSAFLYTPDAPEPQRYDKIHLVPFGEFVPFRYVKGLHWFYRLLNDGPWNPWGRPTRPGEKPFEYSLTPGKEFTVMSLPPSVPETARRFGVTICYEDVIPQIFRRFVGSPDGSKRVDFMLNISNDGWFGHGTQQPQHLVNCAFRAVENRVGVARAVNTGVSGFIDPDGRWHDLVVEPGRAPHAGGKGFSVARIKVDPRVSYYSVHGDVFGFGCLVLGLLGAGDAFRVFARNRRFRRVAAGHGPAIGSAGTSSTSRSQ